MAPIFSQSPIPVGVVGNIRACHARARGSIPRSGALYPIPVSLVGQDTRFSSGRPGFKSRTGNFLVVVVGGGGGVNNINVGI